MVKKERQNGISERDSCKSLKINNALILGFSDFLHQQNGQALIRIKKIQISTCSN